MEPKGDTKKFQTEEEEKKFIQNGNKDEVDIGK